MKSIPLSAVLVIVALSGCNSNNAELAKAKADAEAARAEAARLKAEAQLARTKQPAAKPGAGEQAFDVKRAFIGKWSEAKPLAFAWFQFNADGSYVSSDLLSATKARWRLRSAAGRLAIVEVDFPTSGPDVFEITFEADPNFMQMRQPNSKVKLFQENKRYSRSQ